MNTWNVFTRSQGTVTHALAILCLVTVAVQACALVYYVASVKLTLQNLLYLRVVMPADSVPRALVQYIPYARKLLRVGCKKCMKRYT